MNKIIFHSNGIKFLKNDNYPESASKNIPDWYMKANKYITNPITGDPVLDEYGGRASSFKSCPAILDILNTGYVLKTPCDLFFSEKNGFPYVNTPHEYKDFCQSRDIMPEFQVPDGYYENAFHWYPDWGVELPEGYSAMYIQPLNHYNLPFLTTSGIIDNDKVNTPGLLPFFLRKGFSGILPAHTPYIQIIPFKKEDWQSEFKLYDEQKTSERFLKSSSLFRVPGGGVYKKIMSRKKYV